jgi:endoglucanase
MAKGILADETVIAGGRPVLVAGPWATTSPFTVDPGYLATPAMDRLATTTGDSTWSALADSSRRIVADLTANGGGLPPDWAGMDPSGKVWPASPPSSSAPSGFGLEAARLLVWQAGSCAVTDHEAAARLHPPAGQPLMLVAQAAAARASGDTTQASRLLDAAARLDAAEPSYYGGAWVALGRMLVLGHHLVPCSNR